ncbi:sensor histidine kinase [Pseudonocardia nigra]|uniref:sensor histidine kinase n=1 Tax=Pseudonocardia nigra TaxID=1921578 RepID=UPI001C5FC88C|nr:HAMP domain-containing sensor histidine kinase [Pseudonocardia nigra]
MPGLPRWLRARMGVRAASALSAAVVVAASLIVAGAALVFLVGQSLRHTVESSAEERAQLILERVAGNFRGAVNENAREALGALTADSDLAQVLVEYDESVVVEAATDAVDRNVPISDLAPAAGENILVEAQIPLVGGGSVDAVLVAVGGSSVGRPVDVLYAMPLTGVQAATDTLLFYLSFGIPILIVVAGITTYLFAGRALRPVEAIRTQVAAMTEKDLAQRVPVPAARDEVGRLAETMNGMIARLEDAQGVQRRFVADASHELRSPLATIATGLELLQRSSGDPATVTALRGETARLGKLVEALLLLARADERGLQPRREEVDLDEVAEAERGRPAEGGIPAEVRTEPVRVIGDRGQLARVVRNLVDNGRRHASSRVLVTVGRQGDVAVVEVSDDGPGVPPADRTRVFERFVRLDDARARSDGGSGLGLAIVAEVVAAHGGSVEVTDAPAGGALFRVRLPALEQPAADPQPEPVAAEAPAPQVTPVPVRDADARRDPATMPWGIPPVGSADAAPQPAPRPHPGRAPVPSPRDERRPAAVPVRPDQPGSTIR